MIKHKDARDRRKPVFFFFAMLAAVILIEYSSQRYYDDLNKCMRSMYADRLMPSNYLLRLNDQLHKKQRWQNTAGGTAATNQGQLAAYNDSIVNLIMLYEKTFLTKAESKLWQHFKHKLSIYNKCEARLTQAGGLQSRKAGPGEDSTAVRLMHLNASAGSVEPLMSASFDEAITTLSGLSELQTQEGYKIQSSSKSILDGNFLEHILEIALLFMIGLLAIHWFKSEKEVLTVPPSPSAN
jgi:chemoreceptor-like protein with four helix bundle sensory module